MNLNLTFKDANSNPLVGRKVLFTPVKAPNITASYLTTADSYQFLTNTSGSVTGSIVAGNYRADIATPTPATSFFLTATETGSYVYSGSVVTGSSQNVYFDLINLIKDPLSVKTVTLTPQWNYPVMFNGSIIAECATSSLTDTTGYADFDALVPAVYQVDCKGKVVTTFFISVPAFGFTWNAKDLLIIKPSKGISVKLNDADKSYVLTVSASDARYGNSEDKYYNGNRAIKTLPYIGEIPGGVTVVEWLDNVFYAFVPATVAINSGTTYYEVGSNQNLSITATVTVNDETMFGSGSIRKDGSIVLNTATPTAGFAYTDNGVLADHSYIAQVQIDNDGSPIVISSGTKTATFIYPFLYGVSATPSLSGTALYSALTKDITPLSNKAYSITGTATYLYVAYPASYPDLTDALDPNIFHVLTSFNASTVSATSVGLASNWTQNYKVYQWQTVADFSGNYQVIF
jgi:hypothetical protein